ncbi:MAG: TolC family protein [Polyangiaceae bacterium]
MGSLAVALVAVVPRTASAESETPPPSASSAPTTSSAGHGTDPVDEGGVALSLDDALKRAEEKAPEVVRARYAVREALARRVGAGILMPVNPRLSGDVRPPVTGGTWKDFGYGANLEASLDLGGAPSARVREADRGAEVARTDVRLERQIARAETWAAYVRAEAARARIEETKSLVRIAERILNASQKRSTLGAAGDIEQAAATSELGVLRASVDAALRQREAHVATLRALLDFGPEQKLSLTTPLRTPTDVPEAGPLVERALRTRPEFDKLRARIAQLDATDERLSRETFPRLGAYVGIDAAPVSPIFGLVGLSVEIPVAQRNQGPRAVVKEARAGENARIELQARQVLREVTSTRKAFEHRAKELTTLTETAIPAAERTLELVETGWLAGRFDIFRVTTASRDLARIRELRLDALEAVWLERIALERAVGGSLP